MIYLIRHGQTEANVQGIYYGRSESPLTEQGIDDHRRAVKKLNDMNIDMIIASPRQRCRVLAEKICAIADAELIIDNRLEEINFGIFEGLKYDEAQKKYPDVWDNWINSGDDYQLEGGESISMFEKRVDEFSKYLMDISLEKDVAIISHGGVIASLMCSLLQMDKENKWHFKIGNGSVVTIENYDGYAYIVFD